MDSLQGLSQHPSDRHSDLSDEQELNASGIASQSPDVSSGLISFPNGLRRRILPSSNDDFRDPIVPPILDSGIPEFERGHIESNESSQSLSPLSIVNIPHARNRLASIIEGLSPQYALPPKVKSLAKLLLYCVAEAIVYTAVMSQRFKADQCKEPTLKPNVWLTSIVGIAGYTFIFRSLFQNGAYNRMFEKSFADNWITDAYKKMTPLNLLPPLSVSGLLSLSLDDCHHKANSGQFVIAFVLMLFPYAIPLVVRISEPSIKANVKKVYQSFNENLEDAYRKQAEEPSGLNNVPLQAGSRQPHLTERYIAQQLLQGNVSGLFTQACSEGRVDVVKYCLQHEWPFARAWKNEVVRSEGTSGCLDFVSHLKRELASLPLMFSRTGTDFTSEGREIIPTPGDVLGAARGGHWSVVTQLVPFQSSNPHSLRARPLELMSLAFESAPINTLSLILNESTSTGSTWGGVALFDGLRRAAFRGRLDALNFTLSYFSETDGSNVPPSYQKIWQAAFAGDLASLDAAFGMGYEGEGEWLKVVPVYLAAAQKHDECVRRALLDPATFNIVIEDDRIITKHDFDDKDVRECVLKVLCEMIVDQALSPNQLHRLYAYNEEGRLGGVEQVKNAFLQLTSEHYIAMHRRYTILTSQGLALDPIKLIEHYRRNLDPQSEEWEASTASAMLDRFSLHSAVKKSQKPL